MSSDGDSNGEEKEKSPDGCALEQFKKEQRKFLAAYSQNGNVTRAAENAGVGRNTVYGWRKDPEFEVAFGNAGEEAADLLEEEAWRRARDGLRKMKFNGKEPIMDPDTGKPYLEHEYSDTLLIFLLKGLRPQKYRDNFSFEGNIQQTISRADPEVKHLADFISQRIAARAAVLAKSRSSN